MKKLFILLLALFLPIFFTGSRPSRAYRPTVNDFESANAKDNLISDGAFIDINAMSAADIQSFLSGKNSYLKDYSEAGRSAAQIIYDAAHGYGDGSGEINGIAINTSNGTVNPRVILVNLEKEQSLISLTSRNDNRLIKAMGYACPEGGAANDSNNNGCNDNYEGFTKQVENGAWQLRYNYEAAKKGVSWWNQYYANQEKYYVGLTKSMVSSNSLRDGTYSVTFANAATAALYRYTPHVYNGNYNFYVLYTDWFATPEYHSSYLRQSLWVGGAPGQTFSMDVSFRNTGSAAWRANGANPVILAVHYRKDMEAFNKQFRNSTWVSYDRIAWLPNDVASGEEVTIPFSITIPAGLARGEYRFYAQLVAENYTWLPENGGGAWWTVRVGDYNSSYVSQSMWISAAAGSTHNMSVTFKNEGSASWGSSEPHPVILAVHYRKDMEAFNKRFYNAAWVSADRITRVPTNVRQGESVTIPFTITIPPDLSAGTYQFYVQLVAEGYTWLPENGGGAWWTVRVQ